MSATNTDRFSASVFYDVNDDRPLFFLEIRGHRADRDRAFRAVHAAADILGVPVVDSRYIITDQTVIVFEFASENRQWADALVRAAIVAGTKTPAATVRPQK